MEKWGQHLTVDSSLLSDPTCSLVFTAPRADLILFLQHDHTHYSHTLSTIFLTSTRQTGFTFPTLTDSYVRDAALPQYYPTAFRSNETSLPTLPTHAPLPGIQFFSSALAHTPYCDVIRGGRRPDCMAPWRHLEVG